MGEFSELELIPFETNKNVILHIAIACILLVYDHFMFW